jgi:hypothetical protein
MTMRGILWFLEVVLLPTLPPYRSDTSINFFFGEWEKVLEAQLMRAGGYGKKDD